MNPLHLIALSASQLEDDYSGYQYVETRVDDDEDPEDFAYDDLDHDHHTEDSPHSSPPSSEDPSQDFDQEPDSQDSDYTDQYLVPDVTQVSHHQTSPSAPSVIRYHNVLVGIHSGKSHSEISKETGVPRSTVGSLKKRWTTKGTIDDGRKHNGRPPKLTAEQLRQIETILQESRNTMSSTELLKLLKFDVSARTIRRAKKAIVERRCQETRNSVVMAARSLAAAAAAAAEHNNSNLINLNPFRPPVTSWPTATSSWPTTSS